MNNLKECLSDYLETLELNKDEEVEIAEYIEDLNAKLNTFNSVLEEIKVSKEKSEKIIEVLEEIFEGWDSDGNTTDA